MNEYESSHEQKPAKQAPSSSKQLQFAKTLMVYTAIPRGFLCLQILQGVLQELERLFHAWSLDFFLGSNWILAIPAIQDVLERERDVYHPDLVELFIDKFSISIHMNKTRDKNR